MANAELWRLGRPDWWIVLGLAVLTVVTFSGVRTFEFVRFDDPDYVTQNTQITPGVTWHGIKWALTSGHAANWHPLTWVSHMLDVQLFGLNPGLHHVTSLVFHTCNALLLFVALRRMTRAVWRSAFVACLFAIHPLHVESVAWVSERKDVLSTFFWMLALLAYVGYARRPTRRRYGLVLLVFVLGLLSKPMVVTLPFVLLLLDIWPLDRAALWRDGEFVGTKDRWVVLRLVREKLPLAALSAAASVITVIVQRSGGAVGNLTVYPLTVRIQNAILNYVAYVGKMVLPARLAAFYPYRESPNPWAVLAAVLVLIGVSFAAVAGWRRRPYLLVGWLWYLGTLIPVIGIVQVGLQSMADRYTYVPLVGLFIMVSWGIAEFAERWAVKRVVLAITAGSILAACAVKTRAQSNTWRDSLALWQNAADVTSNSAYAYYNLGVVLVQAGRVDDGIARFRQALRIDPQYVDVHIDLGNALNQRGATDQAIDEFATVVRSRPEYAEARSAHGSLLRSRGRNAEAIAEFREAIRLKPDLASAHNELGNALTSEGRFDDAMAEYGLAVRLAPDLAEAHNNLGTAYARAGKSNEAVGEFLEAVRLKPADPMFHYNAALMLEAVGRSSEAIEHLRAVLRAEPGNEAARRALHRLAPGPGGE